jgi:hypothetical protein
MLSFQVNPALVDSVWGDGTGLAIPAHGEALRVAGATSERASTGYSATSSLSDRLELDAHLQAPRRGRAPGVTNAESVGEYLGPVALVSDIVTIERHRVPLRRIQPLRA